MKNCTYVGLADARPKYTVNKKVFCQNSADHYMKKIEDQSGSSVQVMKIALKAIQSGLRAPPRMYGV